jgi:hypothetical protein
MRTDWVSSIPGGWRLFSLADGSACDLLFGKPDAFFDVADLLLDAIRG